MPTRIYTISPTVTINEIADNTCCAYIGVPRISTVFPESD